MTPFHISPASSTASLWLTHFPEFFFFELDFSLCFCLVIFFHSINRNLVASMRANPGFLNPSTADILCWTVLSYGGCPVHASLASTHEVPPVLNQQCLQKLPGVL